MYHHRDCQWKEGPGSDPTEIRTHSAFHAGLHDNPGAYEQGGRRFLPRLKHGGARAARIMEKDRTHGKTN